ncbi:MAG: hypothetical protein ACRC2S_22650 [Waterburya sp.]
MLTDIQNERPGVFIHIDLRSIIFDSDWRDELHLTNNGFEKIAARFDEVIQSI